MRMSRLIGMHRYEDESLTTYDYLTVNTRVQDVDYGDRIWINTPVMDPNAKISTAIRLEYDAGIYILEKYGNEEKGIREGLAFRHYDYAKNYFAAIDNQYYPVMVGDILVLNQWYSVVSQFGSQSVQISIDGDDYTATRTTEYVETIQGTWQFIGNASLTKSIFSIKDVAFYDSNDTILANLTPCVKNPGKFVGMYDSVSDAFFPAYLNSVMQTTRDNIFSVGNLT